MIFPDVDYQEWKDRFNLPVIESPCSKCGATYKTTVPILMQGLAGLSTPVHGCGEGFIEVVLTPKTKEAEEFWRSVIT